jgi:nucleoside-diphosphate-sugar epimerase
MIVIISGANGLLGKHLVSQLSNDHEIHALVRADPENRIDGVNYHVIDLASEDDFSALPMKADVLIHLAQSLNFRKFPTEASDIFNVNVVSTMKLLDFSRRSGVRSFIFTSSGGVYGNSNRPFNETDKIEHSNDLGFYLSSKLCAELCAQNYSKYMNIIILRIFFMYGKNQNRSMLLPRLVDNVRARNPINIQGDQGIIINPIHVLDAVKFIKSIINLNESRIINIAGNQITSLKKILELISEILSIKLEIIYQECAVPNLIGEINLIKSMNLTPKITLEKGIFDVL